MSFASNLLFLNSNAPWPLLTLSALFPCPLESLVPPPLPLPLFSLSRQTLCAQVLFFETSKFHALFATTAGNFRDSPLKTGAGPKFGAPLVNPLSPHIDGIADVGNHGGPVLFIPRGRNMLRCMLKGNSSNNVGFAAPTLLPLNLPPFFSRSIFIVTATRLFLALKVLAPLAVK